MLSSLFKPSSTPWTPHAYQTKAVKFLLEHAAGALFLEPGLGKSAITLAAIKILKKKRLVSKILIIAPLRVCYNVWPAELQKWTDFNGLTVSVLHGPKKDAALQAKADIYVINPEGLDWLLQVTKTKTPTGKTRVSIDLARWKALGFDTLVVDELSKFKHISTDRFKGLKLVLGTFARRWGLTGSPASNGLLDLFGQCYVLDQGRSLGAYISHYRMQYFLPTADGFGWDIRPGAEEEIYERVRPLALRMAADDYLDMPTLIENNIHVDLPEDAQRIYDELERDLIAKLERGVVVAANAASASMKCIAEGTEVLTNTGWRKIEDCYSSDHLWDGVEWVSVGGLVYNGYKPVIECYGVLMTQDHKVLTTIGWAEAQEILYAKSSNRYDRASVRAPDSVTSSRQSKEDRHLSGCTLVDEMCVRQGDHHGWTISSFLSSRARKVVRLQTWRNFSRDSRHAWDVWKSYLDEVVLHDDKVLHRTGAWLGSLWATWHYSLRKVAQFQKLLCGYGPIVQARSYVRSDQQQLGLHEKKLRVDNQQRKHKQSPQYGFHNYPGWGEIAAHSSGGEVRFEANHNSHEATDGLARKKLATSSGFKKVYDIVNAGPRQRFTVRGSDGKLLLVHNCRQVANGGIYLDQEVQALVKLPKSKREWVNLHTAKVDALADLVDELQGSPLLVAYDFGHDLDRLRARFPNAAFASDYSAAKFTALEDQWNRGEVPLLFGHPQSVGHGLNLQGAGNHVCWHSLTYDYELYDQFIRRVLRQGSKAKKVFVHHIIARGTVDQNIMMAVKSKRRGQNALFEALRDMKTKNKL